MGAVAATRTHLTVSSIRDSALDSRVFAQRLYRHVLCSVRGMPQEQLRNRTRAFAVAVVRFYRALPKSEEGRTLGRQLLRAGTGVGANYRAACRPRSDADFIAKLGTVIEECDETAFWLELMLEVRLIAVHQVHALLEEAEELTRIFVASRETVRRRLRQNKRFKQP
jgi:four helix bundle protein